MVVEEVSTTGCITSVLSLTGLYNNYTTFIKTLSYS